MINPSPLERIFFGALEKQASAERTAFLEEACAGDEELRASVERMLAAQAEVGSFLESPAPGVTAAVDSSELREQPGMVIGPYKLLEQIGEGGMGVVYMAEQQEPVRRKVALKLIKPGMDTRQVIARFEAERQALAVMDHPSIARVLDAGATESGHPYFVMELVRGVPITTYCDENNLSVRERLELFASVCQAIQHAHTKGIIHRDIKPTNVLVTRQDGRPAVKVIDFGVAKAMGQQLTEKTLFTNFAQMIGTPLYMSPEQAEQSGVDIDTRSDIFSLGVLLYELLTGSTPVNEEQMKLAAFDEIRRIIREDEPQTPSLRISGSRTLPAIAAHRHIEPARLSKLVRGELDWIVMKSLEKDRNRRYETANAFAADLLHHLNDEPVQACPPSATYRLGKFVRRNRVVIATATLVAAALVLGTVVSTWQAIRAETARKAEVAQRQVAEVARSAEAEQRKVAEAERGEAEKQRELAEANFQRARQAVDEYFTLVSESTLFDVPGMQPLRKKLLEAALRFYEQTAVERTSDTAVLADLAVTYMRVAVISHTVDRNDDAVAAIDRALAVVDRLRRQFPEARDQHRRLAGNWKGLRPTKTSTALPKDPAAALQTISRLIGTWDALSREFPDEPGFRSDLAAWYMLMGALLASAGQPAEGVAYFEKAKATLQTLARDVPDEPEHRADLARAHEELARYLPRVGRPDEADAECREALSLRENLVAEFPQAPHYRAELLFSLRQYLRYFRPGDPVEVARLSRHAYDLAESLVRDYPNVPLYRAELASSKEAWIISRAVSLRTLAAALILEQKFPEALAEAQKAAQLAPNDFPTHQFLLDVLTRIGDKEQTLTILRENVESMPDSPMAHHHFGVALERQGQHEEAIAEFKTTSRLHPAWEWPHLCMAGNYAVLGNWDKAGVEYTKAFKMAPTSWWKIVDSLRSKGETADREKVLRQLIACADSRSDDTQMRIYRGALYREIGEIDRAIADFSWVIAQEPDRAEVWDFRANCYLREGEFDKAVGDYTRAIELHPADGKWWYSRGSVYAEQGQHDKADADFTKAAELCSNDAGSLNQLAWQFATISAANLPNPRLAVDLATRGIALDPKNVLLPNTLGVAYYRAGNWPDAIKWLEKSMKVSNGGDSNDWFFLAMANWQLDAKDEARTWSTKAIEWMDANQPDNQELHRFKIEAEELMKEEITISNPESD